MFSKDLAAVLLRLLEDYAGVIRIWSQLDRLVAQEQSGRVSEWRSEI
jgi:hypothetical protein